MLQQYIDAIESSNIVSRTDFHGIIITFVNDEFFKISGYSREERIEIDHNNICHPISGINFKGLRETILAKRKKYRSEIA